MMTDTQTKVNLKTLIRDAQTIAVVPSKVAGADSFCAAVGLFYMLLDQQKEVYFLYRGQIPEPAQNLIEKERISAHANRKEVVVTIDYEGTTANKAHYNTMGNTLEIRLGPVPKNFDLKNVKTKIDGFDFDLIIVLGAQETEDLGSVYTHLREEFDETKVLNIDNTKRNSRYGDVNIVDENAATLSTLVFSKASEWGLVPNEKSALALLTGMTYRSNNFGVDNI